MDPNEVAAAIGVHDFSPSNVLADGERITAVLDRGGTTAGDASFDL